MNFHIKSLIAWFAERNRRRRELEELSRMNDYQLKDIGLTKLDRRWILKTGKLPVRHIRSDEGKRTD